MGICCVLDGILYQLIVGWVQSHVLAVHFDLGMGGTNGLDLIKCTIVCCCRIPPLTYIDGTGCIYQWLVMPLWSKRTVCLLLSPLVIAPQSAPISLVITPHSFVYPCLPGDRLSLSPW